MREFERRELAFACFTLLVLGGSEASNKRRTSGVAESPASGFSPGVWNSRELERLRISDVFRSRRVCGSLSSPLLLSRLREEVAGILCESRLRVEQGGRRGSLAPHILAEARRYSARGQVWPHRAASPRYRGVVLCTRADMKDGRRRRELHAELWLPCGTRLGECPRWDAGRGLVCWLDIDDRRFWRCAVDAEGEGSAESFELPARAGCFCLAEGGEYLFAFEDWARNASKLQECPARTHSPRRVLPLPVAFSLLDDSDLGTSVAASLGIGDPEDVSCYPAAFGPGCWQP